MTVDVSYQLIQDIINKASNGYLPPAVFNSFINQAQYSYLSFLLGEFQSYMVGRPSPRVHYSMNDRARQSLTPFIDAPTLLTINSSGLAPYPSDFEQIDAMFTVINTNQIGTRVRYVPQHKWYSALNSVIDPVATNPIYRVENDGFVFAPTNLGNALLSYVETPATINWNFTLDVNGLPVYNPVGSVDPEWLTVDMFEILGRVLRMAGINLSMPELQGYATELKVQGQ